MEYGPYLTVKHQRCNSNPRKGLKCQEYSDVNMKLVKKLSKCMKVMSKIEFDNDDDEI